MLPQAYCLCYFELVDHWDGPSEDTLSSYHGLETHNFQQTVIGSLLYHRFILCFWLPLWNSVKTAAWLSSNLTKPSRFYVEEIRTFFWSFLLYPITLGDILTMGPQFFFFKNVSMCENIPHSKVPPIMYEFVLFLKLLCVSEKFKVSPEWMKCVLHLGLPKCAPLYFLSRVQKTWFFSNIWIKFVFKCS